MHGEEDDEPLVKGNIVLLATRNPDVLDTLSKEVRGILRALGAHADIDDAVPDSADFVLLIMESDAAPEGVELPALKDRAGSALAVSVSVADGRVATTRARRALRGKGATLAPLELVFSPADFGILGLESDMLRERLEVLLTTLVHDADRLRLRREGWEEPEDA